MICSTRARVVLGFVTAVLAAAPAAADGLAVKLEGGYADLTKAKDSAKAIFGSSGGATFGAEIAYGFGDHLYVSVGGRLFRKNDGERVSVAGPGQPVFKLGHPVKIRLVPVFATVGYRFPFGSIVPYAGIAAGVTSFREEDSIKGFSGGILETKRTSVRKKSWRALAGVEIGGGTFRFGVEGAYASVPDTIGIAGVSKVYGEKDLGGFSVVGKLVIALSR
jgi:hypothetical protein